MKFVIVKSCIVLYRVTVQFKEEDNVLKTTYTNARANFASLCDEVTKNREIVIIGRRSGESVPMISADELESLVETAHLMRSPKNAQRLLASLERALKREGDPSTSEKLRKELGLEK